MRRRAYPYGRYLIADVKAVDLGPRLRDFIEGLGFPIVKYDEQNEGEGTLIIGVNKKIMEFIRQKKPSGFLTVLFSGFSVKSLRDTDIESQRVGVEVYLWPVSEGVLMELFVLPYMEHMNKYEIFHLTESDEEEITDWYVCEHVWEEIEPKIASQFSARSVHRRA
jgi:hypothetical protein